MDVFCCPAVTLVTVPSDARSYFHVGNTKSGYLATFIHRLDTNWGIVRKFLDAKKGIAGDICRVLFGNDFSGTIFTRNWPTRLHMFGRHWERYDIRMDKNCSFSDLVAVNNCLQVCIGIIVLHT